MNIIKFGKSLLPLLFVFPAFCFSNNNNDSIPLTADKLIEKGIQLMDNDENEKAIVVFEKVSQAAPHYPKALYQIALAQYSLGEHEKALSTVLKSDSIQKGDVQVLTMIGSLLDDLERYDEAIKVLENARKMWPYNQNLLYNLAIVYANVENYDAAENLLVECVKLAPYHAGTHLLLGHINYKRGRLAESVLAYNMGIVMQPTVQNILKLENIVLQNSNEVPQTHKYPYSKNYDASHWQKWTSYCQSGIAFDSKFVNYSISNYYFNRLTLLLFDIIEFKEADTSIYNQYYVRFFKDVKNKNLINSLFAYQLGNIENAEIKKWIEKNKKAYDTFIELAKNSINEWRDYEFQYTNQKNATKKRYFNENAKLLFLCDLKFKNDDWLLNGDYQRIAENGAIVGKGSYVDDKLQGKMFIYDNDGKLLQDLYFNNGEFDKLNTVYHNNGQISGLYNYENQKRHGNWSEYSKSGTLNYSQDFKNGLAEGKKFNLNKNEAFTAELNYEKGKLQGIATEKWLNGNNKVTALYTDSLLNGEEKTWHTNGQLRSVGYFKNSKYVGKYTSYHPTGKLESEYEYDENGELTGSSKMYNSSGTLMSLHENYTAGKLNGFEKLFYPNANVRNINTMKDGIVTKTVSYDINGNEIYSASTENDELYYKSFYSDGKLRRMGMFKNGKMHGKWCTYSPSGIVISEEHYVDGASHGLQKNYYLSGELQYTMSFRNDTLEGAYKQFFENGTLKMITYYNKGAFEGDYITYYSNGQLSDLYYAQNNTIVGRNIEYDVEGKLNSIMQFDEDGLIHSSTLYDNATTKHFYDASMGKTEVKRYYPNGKLSSHFFIADGQMHGLLMNYYPNGIKKDSTNFVYGKIDGKRFTWDIDGKLTDIDNYCLGKRNGKNLTYNNGKIRFENEYVLDNEEGAFIEYYENGKMQRRIPYSNNEKNGEYEFFSPSGQLAMSIVFEDDIAIALKYRNALGKTITQSLANVDETFTAYYPNGKISAKIGFKNNCLHGSVLMYDETGKTVYERTYKNNYLEGATAFYYSNGKLREKYNSVNDKREGEYVSYTATGLKVMEGNYKAGFKTGIWKYYDNKGNVKHSVLYKNNREIDLL